MEHFGCKAMHLKDADVHLKDADIKANSVDLDQMIL